MKKTWFKIIGAAAISAMALTACGSQDTAAPEEDADGDAPQEEVQQFKVGAIQIVEHPSLDAAYEGFKQALADNGFVEGENISYDFQSAQGDPNNHNPIAQKFVADNVDLIFGNSTPSTQSVLNATDDIPIVFTSVTDPVGAGLVSAMNEAPGANITGVSDLHPEAIVETVKFIDKYFEGSKVGLIYNAGEQNSVFQIEAIEAAVEGTSLSVEKTSVSETSLVREAATSLVGQGVDVIYVVTDNTVVSALSTVVGVAQDNSIPLFVGEPDSLTVEGAAGGFATFGFEYYEIGYRVGQMAAEILAGEKMVGEIPVEFPAADLTLFINKASAEAQGIEWNDEWDELAEFIDVE